MRLGGRTQAAIEVLAETGKSNRPVSEVLGDWGKSHRFAGSGDRAAIGNLVYDCLRKKSSNQWLADEDGCLALALATLVADWGYEPAQLTDIFCEDKFAPEIGSAEKLSFLKARDLSLAPEHVQANVQEWCMPSLQANFDAEWIAECQALSERPPLDLRVNVIKANTGKVAKQLSRAKPVATRISRHGLRIAAGRRDQRTPNIRAEGAYQKGFAEIQDQGSQIVSELVFAQPGENVLDFCAGAGGKTLALAALMENRGQIHAYDADKHRLAPIHERLRRAGVRNVQVHTPDSDLSMLIEKLDRVIVDAPCTGSGTWRRRPDSKWKLTKENLEERLRQQEEVLSEAAPFVRPGGFLIYITCSIFPEENENQVYSFVSDNPEYELVSVGEVWEELYGFDKPQPWSSDMKSITLTPNSTGTDGFFFAVMERRSA